MTTRALKVLPAADPPRHGAFIRSRTARCTAVLLGAAFQVHGGTDPAEPHRDAGTHTVPVDGRRTDTGPRTVGVERTDANSRAAHAQLLQKARTGRIDLYFLGDSITRRWGTADPQYRELYANWQRNFYGWNAADFGWGGDTTANVLWRIEHGELDGVNPKVIVLLAGTNDLGAALEHHADLERAAAGVVATAAAIVHTCGEHAPAATVILTSLTPRTDHPELEPLILRINRQLAALTGRSGPGVRFLDVYARMTASDGTPGPGVLGPDGLHLAVGGYQLWADALTPMLQQLLGPRAATDAAPPPSRSPGQESH